VDGEFLPIEPTLHLPSWVDLSMSHNRAWIVDGNGGEYRMSLHGTATGSAMIVQSPHMFAIQPMV
jgi:hypothetical protein